MQIAAFCLFTVETVLVTEGWSCSKFLTYVAVWFVILEVDYSPVLRKQSSVEGTEITLQQQATAPGDLFFDAGKCNVGMYKGGVRGCLADHCHLSCQPLTARAQFSVLLTPAAFTEDRSCLAPCKAVCWVPVLIWGMCREAFWKEKKIALKATNLWHVVNVVFSSVLEPAVPKLHLRRAVLISRDICKKPSVAVQELFYPIDEGRGEIISPEFNT